MEDYFIFISTENERVCMKRGRVVDENWRNFFFFFIKRIGNPNGWELIEKLETKALIELVLNGDAIILRWRVPLTANLINSA